jgi:glycosyltransferase involved in cell wall biosynthesis
LDKSIVILLPVYNDWKSLNIVLNSTDKILEVGSENIEILIVDDGSNIENNDFNFNNNFKAINKISVITLIKNMGNQRAITMGLCYIEEKIPCKSVIIMDSDGEDRAEDIPKLIKKCDEESGGNIVFF